MAITSERINQLFRKIDQAPSTGILYLSLRDQILLQRYFSMEEVKSILTSKDEDGILEIHLFDSKKEYRWLRSVKHLNGLEHVVSDGGEVISESEQRNTFEENVFVEERFGKDNNIQRIAIVNYLGFDEEDSLRVVDYRLKEVKSDD